MNSEGLAQKYLLCPSIFVEDYGRGDCRKCLECLGFFLVEREKATDGKKEHRRAIP